MSKTVTVDMGDGSVARLSIGAPVWSGRTEIATGVWRTAVYIGKVSGRVVVETDSAWVTHTGERTGTRYHLADADERARLAALSDALGTAIDRVEPPKEL